ncbi:carboxylesterase [Streptomyces sp. 150FB]|uniref:carboxylesterase/lipase family protein n=1 Tax=Streptomyces sp. 150FB TaxID=1576605 RepID=UPI0005895D67|nr:carboxylesterase family protein [Streptomyces sp. 150FB]KIF73982.1 carboxylesterase [Streptomyces sp. 150FB]
MDPVCTTEQGQVSGRLSPSGVASFLGIPYANAPAFAAPPVPVEPWEGVRPAVAYGPTAAKAPYPPPLNALIPENSIVGEPGESPLNLNVWTPSPGPESNLPVMVWIHGGAFANGSGSASAYDGSAFARDGVVFVTLNYRLGTEGFLHLDGVPDNRGLLDQIAALEWVRENIASFGGDPDRVTVLGQSAGAMGIGVLLGMERARGLFRRAILQSGAAHHFLRPASARLITERLARKLLIDPTAEAFAAVPASRLLPAQSELRAEISTRPDPALWGDAAFNLMPFEPVRDELALPAPDCGVDLLVGTTRHEYRLFLVPTERLDVLSERRLRAGAAAYGVDPDTALAVYRETRPEATPGELFDAMTTDWFYRIPAIRLAETVPGTYVYEFAWGSPRFGGKLGACHAAELGFVFDRLDDATYAPMLGEHPPQPLADAMHGAWVAFAATGDPGWSPYDKASRTAMVFAGAEGNEAADDLRPKERRLWDGLR